jgi:hypothetical protein
VITYKNIRRLGYTGEIRIIVDNQDPTAAEYEATYPGEVIVFDKKKAGELFDVGDNFQTYRGVVYARNAAFGIAKDLGYEYFIVLDDDYTHFQYKFNGDLEYQPKVMRNLDTVFGLLLEFFIESKIDCLAIAQGGDFIGGENNVRAQKVITLRKLMNLYVCSVNKPFEIESRINEDVTAYTHLGSIGKVFLTICQITLEQTQTQSNPGGMTELYLESGTYVKSFYSVIFSPSFVSVAVLKDREFSRLHHRVDWKYAVPKILSESVKK